MNYELAKKLKDAGFPQLAYAYSGWLADKEDFYRIDDNGNYMGINIASISENVENLSYCPTLSELIGACGDDFYGLKKGGSVWVVESTQNIRGESKWIGGNFTPEEAVAKLWLALNEKK